MILYAQVVRLRLDSALTSTSIQGRPENPETTLLESSRPRVIRSYAAWVSLPLDRSRKLAPWQDTGRRR
jgi:hypothetical protein